MRALLALSLALAIPLAGCASPDGIQLGGDDAPRDPYYKEHRAIVSGAHEAKYPIPVESGARLLNVTLALDARTQGIPLPETPLARLKLDLLDPAGTLVESVELAPDRPTAGVLVAEPAAGAYSAQVTGLGLSQPLAGEDYGAAYTLIVEILYG